MKLGKNQITMIVLLGLSTTFIYYANKIINTSLGTFSDGILVGFLLCLSLLSSLGIFYIWIRMIFLNFKVRLKKKDVK